MNTPATPVDTATLQVTEMFLSIQGESTWAGLPCGFIRLAGCNLRCVWCDTIYSHEGGTITTLDAIMKQVQRWQVQMVEITGGEPLMQQHCPTLAARLLQAGKTVLVETNGSQPLDALPEGAICIMDIKCPGSGMHTHTHWPNLEFLKPRDEVKFVLASRSDYEWALKIQEQYDLSRRCHAVLFSPVTGMLQPADLAQWMTQDCPPARLQLPLHKYIWPLDQRDK
jgi:7-carboxy-7-deazaguanine synthase